MNTHLESMDEMVAYHQQRLADEFAAVNHSTFWRDLRIRTAHALIRIGEALDDRCREQIGSVSTGPIMAGPRAS